MSLMSFDCVRISFLPCAQKGSNHVIATKYPLVLRLAMILTAFGLVGSTACEQAPDEGISARHSAGGSVTTKRSALSPWYDSNLVVPAYFPSNSTDWSTMTKPLAIRLLLSPMETTTVRALAMTPHWTVN